MNKLICIAALCAFTAFAEASETSTTNTDATAQMELRGKKRRRNRLAEAGGLVTKIGPGRVVQIYDAKKLIPADVAQRVVLDIQKATEIAVKYTNIDLGADGAAATVRIVDSKGIGALVVQPDDFTVILNVGELRKDISGEEHFRARCVKQLWRSIAYALGAGNSNGPFTVMKPFRNMKELDECMVSVAGPETLNVMMKTARKLKMAEAHTMTYKSACQEGWAPEPTNDVQRAIWKKVHTVPDKPITIEFDPKKDK